MKFKDTVWHVAIRNKPVSTILDDIETPFIIVPNPLLKWAADPFLIEENDVLYIFAEIFSYARWKGSIGYCKYENGKFSKWKRVIKDKHHFSFPNIKKRNGNIVIMPETSQIREIAEYEAIQFPNLWKKMRILNKGERLVDSIPLSENQVLSYKMGESNELVLLSKNAKGVWKISDRIADTEDTMRPAGNIFNYQNKTIRPSQDGRRFYGEAINFMEIILNIDDRLPNEKIFKRVEAKSIIIDKKINVNGIHTYNGTENYEVIDLQQQKIVLAALFKRILIKVGVCDKKNSKSGKRL